jgi:hypothetical protein
MGCGPSKPTAAVVVAPVPSTASTVASTARGFSNSPGIEATGRSQRQQQIQTPPPTGEPRHDLPCQDELCSFDQSVDSESNSVKSTHSVGDQLMRNPLASFNSAPTLHETKIGHKRTGSKLNLVDDLKCGERRNHNLVRIEVPLGKPIEEVYEGVHDGQVLGSGVSGIVRRVTHRATKVEYAVKCLDLALIDSDAGLRQLKEEIYIMCQLVSGLLIYHDYEGGVGQTLCLGSAYLAPASCLFSVSHFTIVLMPTFLRNTPFAV